MKYIVNIFLALIFTFNNSFSTIQIIEPKDNQLICTDNQIEFILNKISNDYDIYLTFVGNDNNSKLDNLLYIDNSIYWIFNDSIPYNKLLNFKIVNKNHSNDFIELHNIIIKSKPIILNQTNSALVCIDETVTLKIEASGQYNKYQWLKDNLPIKNENKSILIINNIQYANSGIYSCRIFGDSICSEIRSSDIPVYVITPTKFTTRPNDVQFAQHELETRKKYNAKMEAKLHINSDEEQNFYKFKWYKDTLVGQPYLSYSKFYVKILGFTKRIPINDDDRISGSNSSILNIRDLKWSDRTNYYCFAEGLCGKDSTICYIGENTLFTIKNSFEYYNECEGGDAEFEVKVKLDNGIHSKLYYQWYKIGFGALEENDRYIGTRNSKLIIKNVAADLDDGVYYCKVHLDKFNITQNSKEFIFEPATLPKILVQPVGISITDKTRRFYGQTYIDVTIEKTEGCLYTWFRNGIQARKECWRSDYWLGIDSCPPLFVLPPPRPSQMEDVGWYRCRIRNKCGIVWSDSVYIAWGYDNVDVCPGDDTTLIVEKQNDNFNYQWSFKNKIIIESSKYKNTNSNTLKIYSVNYDDEGKYYCYAINKFDSSKNEIGYIYLAVNKAPKILKDFPNELINDGLDIKKTFVTVSSRCQNFYYQLYFDGSPIEPLQLLKNDNVSTDPHIYPFYLGGYNSNLKPGIYQYYFKNDCDEIWSNKMNVINTAYKSGGIILSNNDELYNSIIKNQLIEFFIYPNPGNDFINIQLWGDLDHFNTQVIQIYNLLGIELKRIELVNIQNDNYLHIDISNFVNGLYFIKIGNQIKKFIKN